jgi:hypothetical protein
LALSEDVAASNSWSPTPAWREIVLMPHANIPDEPLGPCARRGRSAPGSRLGKAADLVETAGAKTLAHYVSGRALAAIRTNNPLRLWTVFLIFTVTGA